MPKGDIYIGLMSGTSMDAIDTAIVQFVENTPNVLAYRELTIGEDIKAAVRRIHAATSIEEVTGCDARMGHLFADSVLQMLNEANLSANEITAIGSHGQTVLHLPDDIYPRTLQIGDPNIIAYQTGITTIADFRRMDMAAGGQGAPLAPAFHETAFRLSGTDRIILNLGGIANITLLPSDPNDEISGFDTGPGNGLLDDWNQQQNATEMDRDSEWAATGNLNARLLESFLGDPYFNLPAPKSTGRDYFNLDWLNRHLNEHGQNLEPEDIQATLLQLTIENIAIAIEHQPLNAPEIYACGGGARNRRLMNGLKERLKNSTVTDTSALGLDPNAIEAITFAWLAKQTIEARSGNNPSVTGAHTPQILGGIYQSSNSTT